MKQPPDKPWLTPEERSEGWRRQYKQEPHRPFEGSIRDRAQRGLPRITTASEMRPRAPEMPSSQDYHLAVLHLHEALKDQVSPDTLSQLRREIVVPHIVPLLQQAQHVEGHPDGKKAISRILAHYAYQQKQDGHRR